MVPNHANRNLLRLSEQAAGGCNASIYYSTMKQFRESFSWCGNVKLSFWEDDGGKRKLVNTERHIFIIIQNYLTSDTESRKYIFF